MGEDLNIRLTEATKDNAEVSKDLYEQHSFIDAMRERNKVLSEIAVKLLEPKDSEKIIYR